MKNSGQLLGAIKSRTLRDLLDTANKLSIEHKDIVQIDYMDGMYILFYYYDNILE